MGISRVAIAGGAFRVRTGNLCTMFSSLESAAEQIALLHDEIERLQKDRSRSENELDRLREWVAAVEDVYDKQKAEIERLNSLVIRAWHSFRSGLSFDSGCDCGLVDADIEELVRMANEHPPA